MAPIRVSPGSVNPPRALSILQETKSGHGRRIDYWGLDDGSFFMLNCSMRVTEVLKQFLKDFKEGLLKDQGWPTYFSVYTLSKAAMNTYTRILAKKNPSFLVNSIGPVFVKTDITCNFGVLTAAEGAENVARLALLPNNDPSGLFFLRKEVSSSF
ncbi:(+)-neomenthol dehydrogenase [Hibiscus syriacus]|uniref:(+)-neomenthol dehydrogenase n=1 Tax=Hibiscus syriacus TaxID=106335 RepID=A0A6A3A316_HIBSY|nr:(+)-neomenthol dehydrogenase-like [Hibiscus syriacus]KAE8697569.1 (+)-neomenthol dehydrogenase [Hibiscus syriacus]